MKIVTVDMGEIDRIGGRAENPDIDAALRILEINGLLHEDEMLTYDAAMAREHDPDLNRNR